MTVRAAIDTNVLIYAISSDPREAEKRQIAEALLTQSDWGISTQVLQEFYVNAIKGKAPTMTPAQAAHAVDTLMERPVAGMDAALLKAALRIHQRYQISYWDAAVIASSVELGATTLYTEDLNHGQVYEGVRAENPFQVLIGTAQ
jgi:predicted nucleic acid-binding protein